MEQIEKFYSLTEGKNVFLVTGKKSFVHSGAKEWIESNIRSTLVVGVFNEFKKNPQIEDAQKGFQEFMQSGASVIIALGGGSTIDIAKLIKALAHTRGDKDRIFELGQDYKSDISLIAIPTTAGSGSEATHFAVVYIGGQKKSVAHQELKPDLCVLDYRLTSSMSPYLSACSGFDAFSQAIESLWNVNSTNESRKYSLEAIELCRKYLSRVVNNSDSESREGMLHAANLAGKAINLTKTTGPHALSYYFTTNHNLAHGHAVALSLSEFLIFNSEVTESSCMNATSLDYVKGSLSKLTNALGCDSPAEAKDYIDSLCDEIGLVRNLSLLEIKKSEIDDIVRSVNIERLQNNPRIVGPYDLRSLVGQLFQDS